MTGAALALPAGTLACAAFLSMTVGRRLAKGAAVQPAARAVLLWLIPVMAAVLMLFVAALVPEGSTRGLRGLAALGGALMLVHLYHLRLLRRLATLPVEAPDIQHGG